MAISHNPILENQSAILRNLSVSSYAQGMTQFFYHAPHSRRALEGHTYWKGINTPGAAGHIQPGDWIFVKHETGEEGNVLASSIYVMGNSGRVVRIASLVHA